MKKLNVGRWVELIIIYVTSSSSFYSSRTTDVENRRSETKLEVRSSRGRVTRPGLLQRFSGITVPSRRRPGRPTSPLNESAEGVEHAGICGTR